VHFIFEIKLIFIVACKHSDVYYLEYKDTCLCLTACDLRTSTNVTLALSLAEAPHKECCIKFIYRHSNCSGRLLSSPRQCGCFSRVGPLIEHIPVGDLGVEGKHTFTRNTWHVREYVLLVVTVMKLWLKVQERVLDILNSSCWKTSLCIANFYLRNCYLNPSCNSFCLNVCICSYVSTVFSFHCTLH